MPKSLSWGPGEGDVPGLYGLMPAASMTRIVGVASESKERLMIAAVLDSDLVLIRDGLDYELVVDFTTVPVTIYSSEGPDAVLPGDLSFGCPPELYPGSLPS